MLSLLIEASDIIDNLFWQQAFGQDKANFLASISDEKVREFARINYGPWDRLNGDKAFLTNVDDKSHGAQFYPADMTKAEFEKATFDDKNGLYSLVRRNEDGQLSTIAFSEAYADEINRIAGYFRKGSNIR